MILFWFYPDFVQILSRFYPGVNIGSHGDDDDAARTRNCLISNPNFIQILFWFYPDFIQILSRFCPDFIKILSRFSKESKFNLDVNIDSHGDDDDAARTRNCLISNPISNWAFWFLFVLFLCLLFETIWNRVDDDDAARTRSCLISNPNQTGLRTALFLVCFYWNYMLRDHSSIT